MIKRPLRFFLFALVFLASCQSSRPALQPTLFTQNIMTIDYHILIGHPLSSQQKQAIQTIIDDTFDEINRVYNKWNPYSELSELNRLQAGEIKKLSPSLFHLFTRLNALIHLTEGRLDPTIEPLQQLWKTYLDRQSIPPPEEIKAIQPCIGWHNIHFSDDFFFKEDSRTQLDLGGIAKGLGVDLLIERLTQAGFTHLFVEWGGEIRAAGLHPAQRPWTIYISRLDDQRPNRAIAYAPLYNQAIATSGDYFQQWTAFAPTGEEITYCHIFNPLTMKPLEVKKGSIASASLVAQDCLTADCLAKVLMLFDTKEEAEEWLMGMKRSMPELKAWLIAR